MNSITYPHLDRSGLLSTLLLVSGGLSLLAVAAVFGVGVVIGGKLFVIAATALIGGLFSLFVPRGWVFGLLIVLTFLVVGPAQYFGGVGKAFWVPYLLGLALFVRLPLDLLRHRAETEARMPAGARRILVAMTVLAILLVGSSLFNLSPAYQVLVAAKEHFFLWSVAVLLALGLLSQPLMDRLWLGLIWLAPLQLPVVLYQRFVIAPSRLGDSAWDAVVGLFGGNPEGGGASAAMAITLIFLSLLAISLKRNGRIGWPMLLLVVGSTLLSIGLAEVKVALLLLPLAIAVLFRGELFRRPMRFLLVAALTSAVSFVGLLAYQAQFASTRTAEGQSLGRYVESVVERSLDSQQINLATGEMGRGTAIRFWWEVNRNAGVSQMLIGHGIGSSRIGGSVVGEAAARYRFRIDRSSLAIYLWEGGVLSVLALLSVLAFAMVASVKGASLYRDCPVGQAALSAGMPLLLIVALLLPYNTDLANVQSLQLLVMLLIGQAALAVSRTAGEA